MKAKIQFGFQEERIILEEAKEWMEDHRDLIDAIQKDIENDYEWVKS